MNQHRAPAVARERNRRRESRGEHTAWHDRHHDMAISNFVVTIVGISAVAMLMKTDVRTSASMLRRNLKHMRSWLEEASAAGAATGEKKALEETATKAKAREQSTKESNQ